MDICNWINKINKYLWLQSGKTGKLIEVHSIKLDIRNNYYNDLYYIWQSLAICQPHKHVMQDNILGGKDMNRGQGDLSMIRNIVKYKSLFVRHVNWNPAHTNIMTLHNSSLTW